MAAKSQQTHSEDDWAGLAQDLFGIQLEKSDQDDDLLNEDLFKIELAPPPEPAPVKTPVADEEITFSAEAPAPAPRPAATPIAKSPPTPPTKRVKAAAKSVVADEPFGAGIAEAPASAETDADEGLTLAEDFDSEGLTLASDYDDGLTLTPDHDAEGLTLPPDYDDGLTLAPPDEPASELAATSEETSEESEVEGEEAATGDRSGRPRRRRRRHEDSYWDMLENWEWEEISAADAPRAERGDQTRGRSGRGGRGDRRGRSDRPRSDRPREDRPREDRPREDRPREAPAASSDQTAAADTPRRGHGRDGGDRDRPPRRSDRGRDDRRRRDERPREASQPSGSVPPPRQTPPPTVKQSADDDFGCGILDEASPTAACEPSPTPRSESGLAQSAQAADEVLSGVEARSGERIAPRGSDSARSARSAYDDTSGSIADEVVWLDDDDSDVRLSNVSSVAETEVMPSGDSDERDTRLVDERSDVVEQGQEFDRSRRPRRARRRGRRPESREASNDGTGTAFDIDEVLEESAASTDVAPAAADDTGLRDSSADDFAAGLTDSEAGSSAGERRGRRRRRRRPDGRSRDAGPLDDSALEFQEAEATEGEVPVRVERVEPEAAFTPINYGKIPTWDEAINYLLNPHLVGRNLGPDDEIESLEGDPRGSGGSEPTGPSHPYRPSRPPRRGGRRRKP